MGYPSARGIGVGAWDGDFVAPTAEGVAAKRVAMEKKKVSELPGDQGTTFSVGRRDEARGKRQVIRC